MSEKLKIDCCAEALASNTPKGPTKVLNENPGTLGKRIPNEFRLTVSLVSLIDPSTVGKNAALDSLALSCACLTDSIARATRGLPSGVSAISTAFFMLNCITFCGDDTCAVACANTINAETKIKNAARISILFPPSRPLDERELGSPPPRTIPPARSALCDPLHRTGLR